MGAGLVHACDVWLLKRKQGAPRPLGGGAVTRPETIKVEKYFTLGLQSLFLLPLSSCG